MRKQVEMMGRSTSAKNADERVVTDRDNQKHMQFFMNEQWRHSDKCKEYTNSQCTNK